MAPSLEIGKAPGISFTQTETKRSTNHWESPRILLSLNISQTDGISPEKRKKDVADDNYDTDFEFCVNGRNSIIGETLLPVADELFVDRKILPPIHGSVEVQPVPIARHAGLESLRCLSPVRSTSSRSAEIRSSCCENVSSKSFRHKPPNNWNEMRFKLSNKEFNACAETIRRTECKVVDQSGNNSKQQPSSTKSVWSFSRSCRTVSREMKGNGLFRFLPFSKSHSTAERKDKAATSGCTCKETETDLSGLVEGPKCPEVWSISNKVQSDRRYYGELKPRFESEKTKAKQNRAGRGKLGSSGLPESRIRRVISGQSSTARVGENARLMVRYMDSPPPGKPLAKGSSNNSMGGGGMRVSPVVNVPVCIGHGAGGRWNGGYGLFGFFSKRKKKEAQPSTYHHRHHSHASTNRKKGT